MDDNKKKGRLIGDALINKTEDFLIEEDDILSDEDVKKNDENLKYGSFSESLNQDSFFNNGSSEPLHSTDLILITEEYGDEDLLNVPSEIIVPDKKHSKTATEYLNIEHITDLYSPNTGTFNTMSVHDVSFVKRGNEIDLEKSNSFSLSPENQEVVPSLHNVIRSAKPPVIQKADKPIQKKKVLDEIDFEKLSTVEFKLEPTNHDNSKLNNPLVFQSDSVKQDQIPKDHDLDFDSKTLDTLVSKPVTKNNIFDSSSIIKELNNKEILASKPNYRDDKFEKTRGIDFDLGDDDYLIKEISFQKEHEDLTETDSRIELSLENDPAIIPRKMTVNMQNIESDIDQITNGDKSNLYRYIKTGNSNLTTANFLKQTVYKQEKDKSIEHRTDAADSEELKLVLNRKDNNALVFKDIDERIKKEAQPKKQVKERSYPNDYDPPIQNTNAESHIPIRNVGNKQTRKRKNGGINWVVFLVLVLIIIIAISAILFAIAFSITK